MSQEVHKRMIPRCVTQQRNAFTKLDRLYEAARDIGQRRVDDIVRDLYPSCKVTSKYYIVGNIYGDEGSSMWVYRTGERKGGWADAGSAATGRNTGDIIHLVAGALFSGDTSKAADYIVGVYG